MLLILVMVFALDDVVTDLPDLHLPILKPDESYKNEDPAVEQANDLKKSFDSLMKILHFCPNFLFSPVSCQFFEFSNFPSPSLRFQESPIF